MYVDKPMKGHNLMQAIARVNRVFRDKPGGLVVDYIGIANDLKLALRNYTESQGRGEPTHQADEALDLLKQKIDIIRGIFATPVDGKAFDYSEYTTRAHDLLVPAANHILGLKDGKRRFLDEVTAITRAFSLCGTLDEAAELRQEIAFFSAVKAAGNTGRHGHRDATLILLAYRHGLRVSELVSLRWEQIDLKQGILHVNRLK